MKGMQGRLLKQKNGYYHLKIGYADRRFLFLTIPVLLLIIGFLAVCVYREIPATKWRLVHFLAIYAVAALLYLNIGVWLHEQLHCLAFRNSKYVNRVQFIYERKCTLILRGHYRVSGAIDYHTMQRALLGPALLVVGLLVIGWVGSLVMPGWWFATMASLAVVAVMDMIHDIYMYLQIRLIGAKGIYWDKGHHLKVTWKKE